MSELVFLWREVTAELRGHTKNAKKILRNLPSAHEFRLVTAREVHRTPRKYRQSLKTSGLLLPIGEYAPGYGRFATTVPGFVLKNHHQVSGFVVGKRFEQHSINHAENRGVRPDT